MSEKSGANEKYDTTYLPLDSQAERRYLHRDYIAHVLRWSFATRMCKMGSIKTTRVLDIGCGREHPLARSIYTARMGGDHHYLGVDVGPINEPEMSFEAYRSIELMEETDFLALSDDEIRDALCGGTPDLVVSFEVLEHMPPLEAVKVMQRVRELIDDGGRFVVSTPNYDPDVGSAHNHVCEWTFEAKKDVFGAVGFDVEREYGTFASQRDYKDRLTESQREMFEQLRDYHTTCMIANIFAPMFPAQSRNAIHVLTAGEQQPLTHIPHATREQIGSYEGDWSSFDAHMEQFSVGERSENSFW